jgi:hypothetical protein
VKETLVNIAASALASTAVGAQGQTILDTNTLLPASLWVAGIVIVWRASWRVSEAVQKFINRMDDLEGRMQRIERKCAVTHKNLSHTQKVQLEIES